MNPEDLFYLGRVVDSETGKVGSTPLLYPPDDLTTHAIVVGMTGSGKTGLCLSVLEEAALQGIPALMIDPKGDIANALLHFPELRPQDFQPWINPDIARREGQPLEQAAAEAANTWQKGLEDWGITPDRIRKLDEKVDFAIYPPGSDAGQPISILASLQAPRIPWEDNRELLREKISSTVTALLGLIGMTDIDPVRSREHILLSNIFETAWKEGKDLSMSDLILQTQSPPFSRLGVFEINTFFPEKDRFSLAVLLNNILAAPAFQTWIEGQPLDIPSLLFGPDGKPRHSIFYVAHLSESERMFFITLLYSAVESWMRTQSGSTSLRALVYFDEISGYLPPLSNPPSKTLILRLLKQARAFGVGQLLATQNPVDVDYKALSNAGTWIIGKLQTERDKLRLLDGLEGAAVGSMDRGEYDRMISGLGKRMFLLHNVHAKGPVVFGTRWAMNYLAGPLSRSQIRELSHKHKAAPAPTPVPAGPVETTALGGETNAPPPISAFQPVPVRPAATPAPASDTQPVRVNRPQPAAAPQAAPAEAPAAPLGTTVKPSLGTGINEYFLPNNLTFSQAWYALLDEEKASGGSRYRTAGEPVSLGMIYRPVLLAQAQVRFLNRKYNLDVDVLRSVLVEEPDRKGIVRWEEFQATAINPDRLDPDPAPGARFALPEAPLTEPRTLTAMQKDFIDWVYRTCQVSVRTNETLKVFAGPQVSPAEFRQMCAEAARQGRDTEERKLAASYDKKIEALALKADRLERELDKDETELSQRRMEELGTHAENLLGLFGGRKSSRRLTSSLSKRRMTEQAKAEVREGRETLAELEAQLKALRQEKAQAVEETNRRWSELASQVQEITVTPLKKDVLLDLFGVAWAPYHQVELAGKTFEMPAFGS